MFGTQLTAMLEAGAALIVGTVGSDGAPRATRAWSAVVVDPAARRVRFTMTADDGRVVTDLSLGTIALTGANVRSFEAIQFKGRVVAVETPTAEDMTELERAAGALFCAVESTDGHPVTAQRRMLPHEVLAVEMVVEHEFDQTPGPMAGDRLGATP